MACLEHLLQGIHLKIPLHITSNPNSIYVCVRRILILIKPYNVWFCKKRAPEMYANALAHLIEETKKGRMFGEWNDYGRLSDQ